MRKTEAPAKRLLNVAECAHYMGRTVAAIRAMQHRGGLPYVKIGGRVQFDRLRLDELIEKNSHTASY